MHRIDTNGHVSNLFNEGDPAVPRLPTQIDKHWLNAMQEEIASLIVARGVSLVKGTNTQLAAALKAPVVTVGTINTAGGWNNSGAIGWRVNAAGTVFIEGSASHATNGEGVTIATLPVGVRPATNVWISVPLFSFDPAANFPLVPYEICVVCVQPNGNITPFATSAGLAITTRHVTLTGLTFHATN